jgi:magnesium-transporting ATPase (P-type)
MSGAPTEATPLIGGKLNANRLKNAVTKLQVVKAIMGERVGIFGDFVGTASDGSVDALGAGLALREQAFSMLEPQDQIGLVRGQDPQRLNQAIAEATEMSGQKRWASLPAEEVARQHESTTAKGLTTAQAQQQLERHGPNALAKGKSPSFLSVWFKQCQDIVSMIILLSAVVNFFGLGEKPTGALMCAYFWVSTFAAALGEYSGAEGLSALSAMGAAACKVVRDGGEVEVSPIDLVPGDIVVVECGDTVPADMRVITCTDLRLDEALLTGESEEVTKSEAPLNAQAAESFPVNMLFSSTAVVAGKGTGVVTATGMNAQVGLIAQRLEGGAGGLSPLQRTMNRLGGAVGFVVISITSLVTLVCYLKKYQDPENLIPPDDNKKFFLFALSQGIILGISCVPVTLPMMTNLLLNTARKEITHKNAIVRKTSSIETLGCCMAICSDKTGTLTEGKMTVIKAVTPRVEDMKTFSFYPTKGFDPAGGIFLASELDDDRKKQLDECVQKSAELKDSCPLSRYGASQESKNADDAHVRTLMVATSLNCYATQLQKQEGKWVAVGNLSEGALVVGAAKAGLGTPVEGLGLLDVKGMFPGDTEIEVPFSSARKMMSTVHAVSKEAFAGLKLQSGQTHVAVVKGAPDRLLPLVQMSLIGNSDGTLSIKDGFSTELRESVLGQNNAMAEESLRVLLVCVKALTEADVAKLRTLDADDRMTMVTTSLAIVGAFGILDPPRQTVKASIARCKSAGIRVVMITGDQPPTAAAIGQALDIVQDKDNAKNCSTLHGASGELIPEDQIDQLVHQTNVWARAQPADKVTIVESLQRQGYTAAMTGDGVNDAPALKLADIGTAMGMTGTAVAKGAADLVLMNDDFTTIVDAVQEGRRTFANVQTYVAFYLSMSFPEVLSFVVSIFSATPMPLAPIQILGMCGVAHVWPALTYYLNPLSDDAMYVPPRRKDAKLVPRHTLMWIVIPWMLLFSAAWSGSSAYAFYQHTGHVFTMDIAAAEGVAAARQANPFVTDEDPLKTQGLGTAQPASVEEVTASRKGSQVARTMNFVTVCIAELLLALAVSTPEPLAIFRLHNPTLTVVVLVMIVVTFCSIYMSLLMPLWAEWTGLIPLD